MAARATSPKDKDQRYGHFGRAALRAMGLRLLRQVDIAKVTGCTVAYVNNMVTGRKAPSARWVDRIADAIDVNEEERRELHIAAAKDNGFKL